MAGKRGLGWAGLGIMLFLGTFNFHGCMLTCGCSEPWEAILMHVRDERGPVDSALIYVYRADDGFPIDTNQTTVGNSDKPGDYVVFSSWTDNRMAGSDTAVTIRLVARKGGRSGTEDITVRLSHPIRKIAGRDTIFIRP